MAGLDGAAVDHDAGAVEAAHGHDGAGHILVASGDGDVGVVPLGGHDGLDAVGDEVARLQAVAHAARAHGDGVAHPDGVEAEAHHAGLGHAGLDGLGETEEVHVAGVALVPDGGDADLGLGEVIIGKADAEEDGLGGALGLGLGDAGAVAVELDIGRGRSGGRCSTDWREEA